MDELTRQLVASREKLLNPDDISWVPIRHHSPACAFYLQQLLDRYQPDKVFIEGSVDFNRQAAALCDQKTVPPVALYGGDGFYPLCDTSPEWVALRWAGQQDKPFRFIDLPLNHPGWNREREGEARGGFLHESYLQHSEYVTRLASELGCRHGDELWERCFENNEFGDAEQFFETVFDYCTLARMTYSAEGVDASGDATREAFMASEIKRQLAPGERCVVVTGGFHSYGLMQLSTECDRQSEEACEEAQYKDSWLIRYSEDRLRAGNGYSAGMPSPGFYSKSLKARAQQKAEGIEYHFLLDVLASLSEEEPLKSALNTASKQAITHQVIGLARLRSHCRVGYFDLMDGLQSVLVKGELHAHNPLIARIEERLAGNLLGSVSDDQPPLPLVADLHRRLRQLKFKLDSTNKKTTKISLYGAPELSTRRALLYQTQFLELGFAEKGSGPNWRDGINLNRQHEEWQYAWTPWVEAQLVDLSQQAPTWDKLLQQRISQRLDEVTTEDLASHQRLFTQLLLMNSLQDAKGVWVLLDSAVADCTDCEQLSQLLTLLLRQRQVNATLFETYAEPLRKLSLATWEQLMFALPTINKLELEAGLRVLLSIQELTREFEGLFAESWLIRWQQRLQWLIRFGDLSSGLLFACKAILAEHREASKEQVVEELMQLLEIDQESAFDALSTVIKVYPQWLKDSGQGSVLAMLNQLIETWPEERFLKGLPDLRFLFSHLDPGHVEQISSQLCAINGWATTPTLFHEEIDGRQVMQAQKLWGELLEELRSRGLDHWLES
ncbi:DUF5682 family protein [Porticoccus sp. GXU_MW_L64]